MRASWTEVDRSAMKRNITFFELIRTTFIMRENSSHQVPDTRLTVSNLDLLSAHMKNDQNAEWSTDHRNEITGVVFGYTCCQY